MKTFFCFCLLFYFCSFSEQSDEYQNYRRDEGKDDGDQNYRRDEVKDDGYQNYRRDEGKSDGYQNYRRDEVKDDGYQNYRRDEVKDDGYQNYRRDEGKDDGYQNYRRDEVKDDGYQNYRRDEVKDDGYQNYRRDEGKDDGYQNYRRDEAKDGAYQKDDKCEDQEKNQHFIFRPCPHKDINCIRGFFAHYSQCLVAEGPVPDPYVLHLIPNIHIPHANLTYDLVNPQIKGLNKFKIEEFYINKATDRLVLEVVFDKLVVTCPEARLKYNRKGKEPLEIVDYTVIEYDDLSFTLTIPHIKDLQLSKGHVYTYINNPYPKYKLGPATYSCKDPGFLKAVAELEHKVGLSLQEAFVTQGPVFFAAFFRSSICVFNY